MLKKIIIAVVVIAVIAGAGLFILDRTIFAPAAETTAVPIAPTIAAPTQAPTQAAAQPTQPPAATELRSHQRPRPLRLRRVRLSSIALTLASRKRTMKSPKHSFRAIASTWPLAPKASRAMCWWTLPIQPTARSAPSSSI
jgi:hypothetical protein